MATDISVKLAVEGEKNFTSAIKAANEEIKNLDAKLKAAEADFDEMTTSEEKAATKTDLLRQKVEASQQKMSLLSQRYEEATDKLNELGEALEKAKAEHGDNSVEALKASTAYNKQATEVSKLGRQLANTDKDMQESEADLKELAKAAEEAGDGFSEASEEMGLFGSVFWGNLASAGIEAAVNGLKKIGEAAVDMVKDAVQGFADYEQLVGGVETLFGQSASLVEQYAQQAYQTAGLSANQYMETVTSFSASLLASLGGDTAAAAEIADQAIIDMADNANKMGTSMESIENAYQGFAKQNYTMLDNLKLGYGGTKTEMERLLADAEEIKAAHGEMASYSIDSYADVVEAIHVVQTEMGITGTTAEEATETISGSIASAQAAFENFKTGIADENADIEQLAEDLAESVITAARNIVPVVQAAIMGIGEAILDIPSALQAVHDRAILVQDTFAGTRARAQEARDAFAEASGAIGSESGTALALVTELYNLADGSNTSAAGQERLKAVVNELNSMIPNLGLEYDDLTGSINLTKDAVLDLIQAQINQEQIAALMEELSAIEQAHAEVEERLAEARRDLVTATNELNSAQTDLDTQATGNVTHDLELKDAVVEATDAYNEQVWYVQQLEEESAALDAEANGLAQQIADLGTSTVETSGASEELADAERELTEEEAAAAKAAEEAARAHEKLVEALEGMPDVLEASGKSAEEMAQLLEEAGVSADQFASGIEDVRDSIINSFQEMKNNTDVTAQSMIDVLTNNLSQQQQWSGNMHDLWDQTWGDEGAGGTVRAFLSYMQEQGPEYASVVEEWANGGYDQLVEAAQLWADAAEQSAADYTDGIAAKNVVAQESGQELAEAGNAGAEAVDFQGTGDQKGQELASGIEGKSGNVANAATQAVNQAHTQASTVRFDDIGRYISAGIASGIIQNAAAVKQAATNVVNQAKAAAQQAAAIASPSKVFANEVGYWITAGIAEGLESSKAIASVYSAMQTVINSGLDLAEEGSEKWAEAVWNAWTESYDDKIRNQEFDLWYGLNFEGMDTESAASASETLANTVMRQIQDAYAMGMDDMDEYVQKLWKSYLSYMQQAEKYREGGATEIEKAAENERKAWKKAYDDWMKAREYQRFILENNGADHETLSAFDAETRARIAQYGQEARDLGYYDEYGESLSRDWWDADKDASKEAESAEKEARESWKNAYDDWLASRKYQRFIMEKNGASDETLMAFDQETRDTIARYGQDAREKGFYDKYGEDLSRDWWDAEESAQEYADSWKNAFEAKMEDWEWRLWKAEDSDASTQEILKLYQEAIDDIDAELENAYAHGLDESDEYVQELLKKRSSLVGKQQDIYDQEVDAYEKFLDKLNSSYDDYNRAFLQKMEDAVNKWKQELDQTMQEIQSKQDQMASKLKGYGSLTYNYSGYYDGDSRMYVEDPADTLRTLEKYGDLLAAVSGMGVPDFLMDRILSMGVDEAIEYMNALTRMDVGKRNSYLNTWRQVGATSDQIAADYYQPAKDAAQAAADEALPGIIDAIAEEYGPGLAEVFAGIVEDAGDSGVDAAVAFAEGLIGEGDVVSDAVRTVLSEALGGDFTEGLLSGDYNPYAAFIGGYGGSQALIQSGMLQPTATAEEQALVLRDALQSANTGMEELLQEISNSMGTDRSISLTLDGAALGEMVLPYLIAKAAAKGTPIVNERVY